MSLRQQRYSWRKLYLHINIDFGFDRGVTFAEVWNKIVRRESFRAKLCVWAGGRDYPDPVYARPEFRVIVRGIQVDHEDPVMRVEFTPEGELPSGVTHKGCSIKFDRTGISMDKLPANMFTDRKIPMDSVPPPRWGEFVMDT